MIKNIGEIAKLLGKEENELKEALSSDKEVEFEIPQGEFYTAEKLTELKTNLTDEASEVAKTKYTEGKDAGREMLVKELKEHFKLEYDGKDVNLFKNKLTDKVLTDAKIEPNKKYQEYETSIENLQKQIKVMEEEKNTVIKDKEGKINRLETDYLIRKNIKGKLKGVNDDQVSLLFRNEYEVAKDEQGKIYVKKDGKTLKDAIENPLAVDVVLNKFIADNNWYEKDGRGGGDQTSGGSFKTMNEAFKYMKENNINPTSEQGKKIFAEAQAAGL